MTKRKDNTSNKMKEKDGSTKESNVKLPRPEAPPREIRKYLVHSLIHKHDVSPDSAQEMADRWKLGRGWDLREMRDSGFCELFGKEIAPYLKRTIAQEARDEKEAATQVAIDCWKKQASGKNTV